MSACFGLPRGGPAGRGRQSTMNACFLTCDGNVITRGVAFAHTKSAGLRKPNYFKRNPEKAPPSAYSFEANIPQKGSEIFEKPYLLRIDKLPTLQKVSNASRCNSSPINGMAICRPFWETGQGSKVREGSSGQSKTYLFETSTVPPVRPRTCISNTRRCTCAIRPVDCANTGHWLS